MTENLNSESNISHLSIKFMEFYKKKLVCFIKGKNIFPLFSILTHFEHNVIDDSQQTVKIFCTLA
jgi:hypothetical protein